MQNYYHKPETFQGEIWENLPGQYDRLVAAGMLRANEPGVTVYTTSNESVSVGDHIIKGSQIGVFVVRGDKANSFFNYGH